MTSNTLQMLTSRVRLQKSLDVISQVYKRQIAWNRKSLKASTNLDQHGGAEAQSRSCDKLTSSPFLEEEAFFWPRRSLYTELCWATGKAERRKKAGQWGNRNIYKTIKMTERNVGWSQRDIQWSGNSSAGSWRKGRQTEEREGLRRWSVKFNTHKYTHTCMLL